jgi:hypothetical protein
MPHLPPRLPGSPLAPTDPFSILKFLPPLPLPPILRMIQTTMPTTKNLSTPKPILPSLPRPPLLLPPPFAPLLLSHPHGTSFNTKLQVQMFKTSVLSKAEFGLVPTSHDLLLQSSLPSILLPYVIKPPTPKHWRPSSTPSLPAAPSSFQSTALLFLVSNTPSKQDPRGTSTCHMLFYPPVRLTLTIIPLLSSAPPAASLNSFKPSSTHI